MLGWLWRVLIGTFVTVPECQHVWSTEEYGKLLSGGQTSGHFKHLKCTICGNWKFVLLN
jgi:hypothetical protein